MSDDSESKLFATLNPVAAAHDCQEVASKVTECFEGTRHQLLLDIENWRANESSVPIFILDGIAGIGKTTVVKTFCTLAAAERRLAASWFFSRDQQDRKSTRGFVGTLAFQLASYHPALRDRIAQALKDNPDILQKTIRAQFNTLIHEPLQAVLQELEGTHSVSIDAIDECDLDEATEILSILLGTVPKHPQLRVLITCRPERPFRLLLQKHQGPHVFHLHEIENSVVESDIRLYINYRLSPEEVDNALPDLLPPPWRASAKEKEALVQMAGKLFIVASTAINFILDPRRLAPARQMRQLLDATTGSALASSPMERLYTQVLRAAVPDPVDDWFDDYQAVVGAIVVAADVLPIQSLASLLDKEPNDIVGTLSHLHSLVAPTSHNEAFRVHHKSFPDFVTDPSRCSIDTRFLIDTSAHHFHLAGGCLRVMVTMLKQNICELPFSDWSKCISELPPGTVDRIPPELAYACTHWISHFQQGLSHFNGSQDSLFVDRLNAFVNEHLLSWLEVVALKGRFPKAWSSVNALSEALLVVLQTASGPTSKTLSHVVDMLQDCLRIIGLNPDLPWLYPMQIYLSSLPFAPRSSAMSKNYTKYLPKEYVKVISGVDENWDPVAVVFKNYVRDMRFSPCGSMVANWRGCLELYDAKSGGVFRELHLSDPPDEDHFGVAFSPDGHLVAVGLTTRVYVWKVASGELVAELLVPFASREVFENEDGNKNDDERRIPLLTSITFIGDWTSIVAGREDGTLFLWTLEGDRLPCHVVHTRKLNEACRCSPSGFLETCKAHHVEDLIALSTPRRMISVAGREVEFWDPSPPNSLTTITRHVEGDHACPVSLSLNKAMLAIELRSCIIGVYSTNQPRCTAVLSGHQGPVTTTAFSPDCEELCSASEDMTVRLWNITTSTQLRLLTTTPSILTDAVFAKSVGRFVFRSEDRMAMLTDIDCTAFGPTIMRSDRRNLVRLSLDASAIAIHTRSFTIFSSLKDLTSTPPFDFDNFPLMMCFFPTGELVAGWNKEPGLVEFMISELKGSAQVASTSFKIMDIDPDTQSFVVSPDRTRVAVVGALSSVLVYNIYSQKLEASLGPPPEDAE
ncbi:quinon protein alcohol dehydrogenase-like superfamily [Coprinopsis sp. MPI-PUGE-AT-0042]|nr:quinon protein alcohol dehydrogenase-like superfamily [Coprinopsis sp. MPI-PUGE-AT-0042]